ncbi:MAG: precorrin-6y C5,15-methyltransferase (decarboxylating) subunit CbiE [Stellaceae bacterium]
MNPWLAVIGLGEDGLPGLAPAARALIETAEVLAGGARHLAMMPQSAAERLPWERPFARTVDALAARRGRRVVVLASGDPLWYGVGVTLAHRFSAAEMTILPQPGAFALAAARLAWPLAECATLSLHGRPLDGLRLHLAPHRRLLVLSENGATPRAVAELLTRLGWGPSRMTVLAHLGGAQESLVVAAAEAWGAREVPDLNTIALECRAAPGTRASSRLPGLPDDAFLHDGQLTKREVRAVTLSALAPLPGQVLWDIGAGCGSVAIEWLRSGAGCAAIAVERRVERAALIARNAAMLGVPDLRLVTGAAPAALAGLPRPDAVFLGGGLDTPGLLESLWAALRPGGRLVANAVTLDGEARLFAFQREHGGALARLAVSRAAPLGPHLAWPPALPVTQFAAEKPADP